MKIAMIVPNLPPTVCGVCDYTRRLAEHWPGGHAWTLSSPHRGHAWAGADAATTERDGPSLAQSLAKIAPEAVALHYAPYGYARDGVPLWLAEGLAAFKKAHDVRLAVMFHEYAYSGPPWRRAYWRKPRQVALARRLSALADSVLTGVPQWRQALSSGSGKEVLFAPIPSNIDPLNAAEPGRKLRLGVFGLAAKRGQALTAHKRLLTALAKHIEFELCLIGEGVAPVPKPALEKLGSLKVIFRGGSDADCSRALSACHALLSPFDAPAMWKSGAAMAALAHGRAVIAAGATATGGPPVLAYAREHAEMTALADTRRLLEAGKAGRAWYEANSGWPRAVAVWQKALA